MSRPGNRRECPGSGRLDPATAALVADVVAGAPVLSDEQVDVLRDFLPVPATGEAGSADAA